jgi:iron complex transport system substrate-binding protein
MNFRKLLFASTLISLVLTACGGGTPTTQPTLPEPEVNTTQATSTPLAQVTFPLTITDGLQRTITLETPAQRIISLAPSNTEILFAIGAGSQVIGRDPQSDFPEEATAVEDIGDTFIQLNTELIISLEPDLVLAAEITPPEQVSQLEQLGVVVFWLANPRDFEGLYSNLITVGQLSGHELEAASLADSLRNRVVAVQTAVSGIADKPVVFYEVDGLTDPSAPYTAGAGTFIDLIITTAGGVNAAAALEAYKPMSIEELLVQDPDFILLGDAMYGATPDQAAQRAGWGDLAAVQEGRVLPFDDNLMSRPGPRMIDAIEQLARILHPDLFN